MTKIETKRLIFRELNPSDLEGIFLLDSDLRVLRCPMNHPVKHGDGSTLVNASILDQYEGNRSGSFVGGAGLRPEDEPMKRLTRYDDLGFRLLPSF